jgi:hypothetical protein
MQFDPARALALRVRSVLKPCKFGAHLAGCARMRTRSRCKTACHD